MVTRRQFMLWLSALSLRPFKSYAKQTGNKTMYGLIGKMLCVEGKRDELAHILMQGTAAMPGCLAYVVANDNLQSNALWITEVWIDQAHHQASLALPEVQAAINQGRPLITGFGERFETSPLGGTGLRDAVIQQQ